MAAFRTVQKKNTVVLASSQIPVIPMPLHKLTVEEADATMVGALVQVQGRATARRGMNFSLTDDTGTLQVAISAKSQVKLPSFLPQSELRVTGILAQGKNGLRLVPRAQSDIELLQEGGGVAQAALPAGTDNSQNAMATLSASFLLTAGVFTGLVARHKAELVPWIAKGFWRGLKRDGK